MLLSIIVNFFIGIGINKPTIGKKWYLVLAIIFNCGLLFTFKYLYPLTKEVTELIGNSSVLLKEIVLPIGISFYTFQILSYIIDLYRGEIAVQTNIIDFALYVSFFPQLVAGPIVKYKEIEKQLHKRVLGFDNLCRGIERFIVGLGKKVIIANSVAKIVTNIFAHDISEIGTIWIWVAAIAYSLQIYYDFSGYSDMAIGLGQIFGFKFMENFNYPYISKSITEFWRRWHISLSTWFKEYIYIPLGGNRKGKIRTYINLWIVFIITGIWHGATLNFWLWGIWHGFFIFIERVFLKKWLDNNKISVLNYVYVGFVVVVGWAVFRCDSLSQAIDVLKIMFSFSHVGSDIPAYNILSVRSIFILLLAFLGMGVMQINRFVKQLNQKNMRSILLLFYIIVFLISSMLLVSGQYNPFIYFKF